LRRQGIRNGTGRKTDPENYKLHDPPYGISKKNGKLVTNKSEVRVCRMLVELRDRQGKSIIEIGRMLEARGLKNRKGLVAWNYGTISRILQRWIGKL
jgi:hypothetical protein